MSLILQRFWIPGYYLTKSPASACECGARVKELACQLLNNSRIRAARTHQSGNSDNALAFNNLMDTCSGEKASRSRYKCRECPSGAPGGTTCLEPTLLDYLTTLARTYSNVYITELAGACHNCNSRHYSGSAVDLRVRNTTAAQRQGYKYICSWMGGRGIDEGEHVHCQF